MGIYCKVQKVQAQRILVIGLKKRSAHGLGAWNAPNPHPMQRMLKFLCRFFQKATGGLGAKPPRSSWPPPVPTTLLIKEVVKMTNKKDFNASAIVTALKAFEMESTAEQYLIGLNLTKPQLQTIVDASKITYILKSATKKEMIKKLVDFHVGMTVRSNTIRNVDVSMKPFRRASYQ